MRTLPHSVGARKKLNSIFGYATMVQLQQQGFDLFKHFLSRKTLLCSLKTLLSDEDFYTFQINNSFN